MSRLTIVAAAIAMFAVTAEPRAQQAALAADRGASVSVPVLALAPTNHPRLSLNASHLWLAPETSKPAAASVALGRALTLYDQGNDVQAIAALSAPEVQTGILGPYATYYAARAHMRLGKYGEALRMFRALQQRDPAGYMREAAAIGEAEALEESGDHDKAADIYDRLSKARPLALDDVLMRLGREAQAAGDEQRALEAYARVYYEFPLNETALTARARLDASGHFQPITAGSQRFKFELGRAQRLFGAKQYAPARSAFDALQASADGDDREVVNLRIAESDYYLKRYHQARDGLTPYTAKGARQAEALYFQAVASRALGDSTRRI